MKRLFSLMTLLAVISMLLSGCTDLQLTSDTITDSIATEDVGLAVHFIDVGQGDCILIESEGSFALVDAGEYSERNRVISYLTSVGVTSLDYMISTHPHSDHCAGLSEVIRNFDTSVFISPDADSDSNAWEYVLDAADERGVTFETPDVYDTYTLGEATITILSPSIDAVYSSLNDYSIVCMVEYGDTSFLLTGDAEKNVEKELVRSGYDLSADVLKCGHHGSSTSSCDDFLDAVNPSAAIITCGKDNDYGHPHREVVEALGDRNIPIWRTDISGSIVATSDGKQISISTADAKDLVTEATANPDNSSANDKNNPDKTNSPYIGNKNSKVFHKADCSSVENMSSKNKVNLSSRSEATDNGYSPCGSCDP